MFLMVTAMMEPPLQDLVRSAFRFADVNLDIMALKKRGFLRIIAAEDRYLKQSRDLIKNLQKAIGEMR